LKKNVLVFWTDAPRHV